MAVGSTTEACDLPGRLSYDVVLAESDDLLQDKASTEHFMARISGIPLILMSESECTTHVFQGIKLGAVDFLKRPLSELKLRVIWQHAVRKMMNDMTGTGIIPNPFQSGKSPATSESNIVGSFNLATTAAQLSGGPSVFSNVGVTPCQLPMDMIGPSPKEEGAAAGVAPRPAKTGSRSGSSQGKQATRDRRGQGSNVSADAPEPSKRRQRKSARDSSAQCVPSAPTPPVNLGVPPLLGVPPGCIPPVASNGMAVGMPILNQPPFITPPMGLSQMANVGNVPVVPFPSFPLVSVPTAPPSGQTPHWPGPSSVGAQSLPDQSATASGADDAPDMAMDFEESEQSPLGLTLRKSPSLVNMISKNLEGVDIDQ